MTKDNGNVISTVFEDTPAHMAGLKAGDRILSINDRAIETVIDLMFYVDGEELELEVYRKGKTLSLTVEKDEYDDLGVELRAFEVRTCKNKCLFCFVSQLPKGMRRSLYVKDEDHRMSFLYGNYITLTNLSKDDKKKIVEQKLSPLYISVHSVNTEVRNLLLGKKDAPDILEEIDYLVKNNIYLHAQIVLCPGINDGEGLLQTVEALYAYQPHVLSVAVVPVGLTLNSNPVLKPVTSALAESTIKELRKLQKKYRKETGDNFVYPSDELYLRAKEKLPSLKSYGELGQIENGVGMLSLFLHQCKGIKPLKKRPTKRILTFTGQSFYPYLKEVSERLGNHVEVFEVENTLFGSMVTVCGLLPGKDILKTLKNAVRGGEVLLIPDVALKADEDVFIDDITLEFLKQTLNVETIIVDSTFEGFINTLEEL